MAGGETTGAIRQSVTIDDVDQLSCGILKPKLEDVLGAMPMDAQFVPERIREGHQLAGWLILHHVGEVQKHGGIQLPQQFRG